MEPKPEAAIANEIKERSLDSDVFFDMLVNKVADRAMEKYDQAHARSRQRIAIVSTVLGALAITFLTNAGSTVVSSLRESVGSDVRELTTSFLEEKLPELEESVVTNTRDEVAQIVERSRQDASSAWRELSDYNTAEVLLAEFEDSGSFSNTDANRLLDLLSGFADDDRYREIPKFPELLERTVDAFAGAKRQDLTSRLENFFGDMMTEDSGIIITMVVTLGDELISNGFKPYELSEGPILEQWRGNRARFQVYSDAARTEGIPSLPYFYDILVACVDGPNRDDLFAVVERGALFTSQDRDKAVQTAQVAFSDNEQWTAAAMERNILCLSAARSVDEYGMINKVIEALR